MPKRFISASSMCSFVILCLSRVSGACCQDRAAAHPYRIGRPRPGARTRRTQFAPASPVAGTMPLPHATLRRRLQAFAQRSSCQLTPVLKRFGDPCRITGSEHSMCVTAARAGGVIRSHERYAVPVVKVIEVHERLPSTSGSAMGLSAGRRLTSRASGSFSYHRRGREPNAICIGRSFGLV